MFIKFKCLDKYEVIRKSDIKNFVLDKTKSTMTTYHNDQYTLKTEVVEDIIKQLEEKEQDAKDS